MENGKWNKKKQLEVVHQQFLLEVIKIFNKAYLFQYGLKHCNKFTNLFQSDNLLVIN